MINPTHGAALVDRLAHTTTTLLNDEVGPSAVHDFVAAARAVLHSESRRALTDAWLAHELDGVYRALVLVTAPGDISRDIAAHVTDSDLAEQLVTETLNVIRYFVNRYPALRAN